MESDNQLNNRRLVLNCGHTVPNKLTTLQISVNVHSSLIEQDLSYKHCQCWKAEVS